MSTDQFRAAADLLWEHWQAGTRIAELPPELRPATRRDGYAIQALLESRSASPLFGWKIAATSRAGQEHIGVDAPLAGRLLRERVADSGAALPLGTNHMRVAEAELALRMGRSLAPRSRPYGEAEVLAAVEALHPAIEIPDSRYDDFASVGAPQLIADDACAHLFVLGAAAPDWRGLDLAEHEVTARVTDAEGQSRAVQTGRGKNALGGPLIALTWLVNELSSLGIGIAAGAVVTTGTCVVPVAIAPGDLVEMDAGPLGGVSVRIL